MGVSELKIVLQVQSGIMNYLQGNTLLRYLLNQCTVEEKKQLADWLDESQQNKNTLNYLRGQVNLMSL